MNNGKSLYFDLQVNWMIWDMKKRTGREIIGTLGCLKGRRDPVDVSVGVIFLNSRWQG